MTNEVESRAVPKWVAQALGVLESLSGWVFLALTAACAAILFVVPPEGIDLQPIRRDFGGWFVFGAFIFGFLTVARFIQWSVGKGGAAWDHRQARRQEAVEEGRMREAQAQYEREALAHLETLSDYERDTLRQLVASNQRTGIGPYHTGVLHTLRSKGLVEMKVNPFDMMAAPHTVPEFVWRELLQRREQLFPPDRRPGRR